MTRLITGMFSSGICFVNLRDSLNFTLLDFAFHWLSLVLLSISFSPPSLVTVFLYILVSFSCFAYGFLYVWCWERGEAANSSKFKSFQQSNLLERGKVLFLSVRIKTQWRDPNWHDFCSMTALSWARSGSHAYSSGQGWRSSGWEPPKNYMKLSRSISQMEEMENSHQWKGKSNLGWAKKNCHFFFSFFFLLEAKPLLRCYSSPSP